MKTLIEPYLIYLKLGAVIAVLLYIGFLYMSNSHLELKIKDYEAAEVLWKAENTRLATEVQNQNKAVEGIAKIGADMQLLGENLLKQVRLDNTIRQDKINSAAARIILDKTTDCETAITEAKKELVK
jgi:hypothetical protein